MSLSNEELVQVRSWLRRFYINIDKKLANRESARKHRELRKMGWRKNIPLQVGKRHRCGRIITEYDIIIENGKKHCRQCDNLKMRRYKLKKMIQNFLINIHKNGGPSRT